jgi:hypothetical protein
MKDYSSTVRRIEVQIGFTSSDRYAVERELQDRHILPQTQHPNFDDVVDRMKSLTFTDGEREDIRMIMAYTSASLTEEKVVSEANRLINELVISGPVFLKLNISKKVEGLETLLNIGKEGDHGKKK